MEKVHFAFDFLILSRSPDRTEALSAATPSRSLLFFFEFNATSFGAAPPRA